MKKVKGFAVIAMVLMAALVSAQEVKVVKNDINVDGTKLLTYEKVSADEFSVYGTDAEEIVNLQFKNNGTESGVDDFFIINFIKEKQKITSNNLAKIYGFGTKDVMKKLTLWLLKEKVLNADGTINAEQIAAFRSKYAM